VRRHHRGLRAADRVRRRRPPRCHRRLPWRARVLRAARRDAQCLAREHVAHAVAGGRHQRGGQRPAVWLGTGLVHRLSCGLRAASWRVRPGDRGDVCWPPAASNARVPRERRRLPRRHRCHHQPLAPTSRTGSGAFPLGAGAAAGGASADCPLRRVGLGTGEPAGRVAAELARAAHSPCGVWGAVGKGTTTTTCARPCPARGGVERNARMGWQRRQLRRARVCRRQRPQRLLRAAPAGVHRAHLRPRRALSRSGAAGAAAAVGGRAVYRATVGAETPMRIATAVAVVLGVVVKAAWGRALGIPSCWCRACRSR
jgi:hypothetical protein